MNGNIIKAALDAIEKQDGKAALKALKDLIGEATGLSSDPDGASGVQKLVVRPTKRD